MSRRQNLVAAAASFAVALVGLGTAVATPASAEDPSPAIGRLEGGMHRMMGAMEMRGGRSHEATHAEMHALCHRMMGGDHRGDGGGDGR